LLFVQCAGRGTRIPEGIDNLIDAKQSGIPILKDDCILLDVVDVTTKHSLVTLPKLFGMGERLDLRGKTITQALADYSEVQEAHPGADLSKADDLSTLKSYAESVDLFSMKWANEVLEGSKLQWHHTTEGHYALYLPDGRVDIFEDLLQKWNVVGRIGLNNIDDHGIMDLVEAFRVAEDNVRLMAPEALTLVRREAKWHKGEATAKQLRLLRKFRIPIIPGLTKGQAQIAISKFLNVRKNVRSSS
jgi:hypothetical protein